MTNHIISNQEVVKLLSQLGKIRAKYPPELLAARRRIYLSLAAQWTATRNAVSTRKKQFAFLTMQVPASTVIRGLVVIFVAFLITFMIHAMATGNLDFGWVMELLLSR